VWALVFRLMFLSGVTKTRERAIPRGLHFTALDYHFWTQPLPTWPAWYAQWLPQWMHHGMTLAIIPRIRAARPVPHRRSRAVGRTARPPLGVRSSWYCGPAGDRADRQLRVLQPAGDRLVRVAASMTPRAGARCCRSGSRPATGAPLEAACDPRARIAARAARRAGLRRARSCRRCPAWRGWVRPNPLLDAVAPLALGERVRVVPRDDHGAASRFVIEGGADTVRWREYRFRWKHGDPAAPRRSWRHTCRGSTGNVVRGTQPGGRPDWLVPLLRRLLEGPPRFSPLRGREHPFRARRPLRAARLLPLTVSALRTRAGHDRRVGGSGERVGYLTEPLSLGEPPR